MRRPLLRAFAIFLLSFCIFLGIAWFVLTPQTTWSPDEGAKLLQLLSIRLEDGRLSFNIPYRGRALDPALTFVPFIDSRALLRIQDGEILFRRLPFFTLLSKPFSDSLGFYGLYILPALGGALMSTLTLFLVQPRERRPAMWVFIALASPVLIYSTTFWEHTLASGIALFAAWIALRVHRSGQTYSIFRYIALWTVIGALLATSAYLRLETAIFSLAFLAALLLIVRHWSLLWGGGVFVLLMLPYSPLHVLLFGQAGPDNASHLFRPFVYLSRAGWQAVQGLLIGPASEQAINTGWLGGLWAIAAVLALSRSFDSEDTDTTRRIRLWAMGITIIIAALFLFTSTEYRAAHGLLFTTPWVLLGLSRLREVWFDGHRQARVIVLTVIFGFFGYIVGLLVLRGANPHGGLEWGSRFYMTFFPLLAVVAGWRLTQSQKRSILTLVVFAGLLFLGLGFQIRGLSIVRRDKEFIQEVNQELLHAVAAEIPIVTDVWWLPFHAPTIYVNNPVYVTPGAATEEAWLNTSLNNAIPRYVMVSLNERWFKQINNRYENFAYGVDEFKVVDNIKFFYLSENSP